MDSIFNPNHTDKSHVTQRVLQRAANLWGLEHPSDLDPLVKLLLDAVAFEVSTLQQQMVQLQGKTLEQSAKLLLPKSWLRPKPAHGIVSLQPLENQVDLGTEHQFYLPIRELSITGEETVTDRFFSPLYPIRILRGHVHWQVAGDTLYKVDHNHRSSHRLPNSIPHDQIWLGIALEKSIGHLSEISFRVEFPAKMWDRLHLLEQLEWFDAAGNPWEIAHKFEEDQFSQYDGDYFSPIPEHRRILGTIAAQYRHRVFQLRPLNDSLDIVKSKIAPPFSDKAINLPTELLEEDCFWLSARFPASFNPAALHSARFSLNCVPMVNRKLATSQTKVRDSHTILPLSIPESYFLFAMKQVNDDKGRPVERLHLGPLSAQSSYSIHETPLERFDQTTAEAYLAKMIRLVREEAHIFAVYGQEVMLKQMGNLKRDLAEIYQQIDAAQLQERPAKTYLSISSPSDTTQVEAEFWMVPEPWDVNRALPGTKLLQYKEILVQPGSCVFQSPVVAGKSKVRSTQQVEELQYALLTRERIVSKSDIKLFIQHHLGQWVQNIEIRNGVAISEHHKRGLIRTVDILLSPSSNNPFSENDWHSLLLALSGQLNQQSVHGSEFRIKIAPTLNRSTP